MRYPLTLLHHIAAVQDDDFQLTASASGFAAARLETDVALSVAPTCSGTKRRVRTTGWVELGSCDDASAGWSSTGYASMYITESFDALYGRFTAPSVGMYFASAQVSARHLPHCEPRAAQGRAPCADRWRRASIRFGSTAPLREF